MPGEVVGHPEAAVRKGWHKAWRPAPGRSRLGREQRRECRAAGLRLHPAESPSSNSRRSWRPCPEVTQNTAPEHSGSVDRISEDHRWDSRHPPSCARTAVPPRQQVAPAVLAQRLYGPEERPDSPPCAWASAGCGPGAGGRGDVASRCALPGASLRMRRWLPGTRAWVAPSGLPGLGRPLRGAALSGWAWTGPRAVTFCVCA